MPDTPTLAALREAEREEQEAFRALDHACLCLVRDKRGLVPPSRRADWELYRVTLEHYRDAIERRVRGELAGG